MPDVSSIMPLIQELLATWGLKVVAALAILILGRLVAGVVRGMVRRGLSRTSFDATLTPFMANVAYVILMLVVVYAAADTVGIPMNSVVAIIGAAGLAVALAFQGTLSNFSSGVLLLTFRPFAVGDFVDAAGTSGTVKEIGVFTTTLATPDNVKIIVPNSSIASAIIRNFSANETRRIDLVVGVSYDDDLNLAMDTIQEILRKEARILEEPEPVVAVDAMADSSVNFVVRPWVNTSDYWPTRWALTKALKEGLEDAGCSIPYPQRDVHLHGTDAAGNA